MNGYRTMANKRLLTAAGIAAALALVAGCSVHKQEAPSLTGPSGLGTNITITVSPDVLTRDGASQSLVTVTVTGPTGQAVANQSVRLDVLNENGQVTDALGTLSAKNVVTNGNGQATAIFTAPAAIPGVAVTSVVQIGATPSGTNFSNETMRMAQLELVPKGVIGAPPSSLKPDFTPPTATVGDNAVFTATVVDSKGADARSQVTEFNWDFGDGSTGFGASTTHTFTSPGVFPVTLEITDAQGSIGFVTHSVTVGQGQLPTATFVFSPTNAVVGSPIHFNASASTAAAGHVITVFAWNFGDGTLGDQALIDHTYTQAGTYTVTLKVTDDAGRKSALTTQTITVTTDAPTAKFTATPNPATIVAPATTASVSFDGTSSTATSGHTIVRYDWSWGDGSSTSNGPAALSHTFSAGTYPVTLTVTDDAGKQAKLTISVVVN